MVKAKKNSYRRVYRNDGTYHYPKDPANMLRREGEEYFENWEIQGVSEGTAKNPKFSLLKYKRERLRMKLDALKQQITHETGKIVVLYGQTDNAPPHQAQKLKDFQNATWLFRHQPPNSPLTNVQDASVFPAMAKRVTEFQGLFNHGRYLEGEKLWEGIDTVYNEFPEETLARGYVHHSQMVNAIYHCDGGDDFVKGSGALHCGVRRACVPFYNNDGETDGAPSGVQIVESLDEVDMSNLRYPRPDVSQYDPADYLTMAELEALVYHMDDDCCHFERYANAITKLQTSDEQYDEMAEGDSM
jgi:hypothetical protein